MIDEVIDTRDYSRPYCPGCEPDTDPISELVWTRWCDTHEPKRDGADDERVTGGTFLSGCAEPDAETCRAFAELLRQPR